MAPEFWAGLYRPRDFGAIFGPKSRSKNRDFLNREKSTKNVDFSRPEKQQTSAVFRPKMEVFERKLPFCFAKKFTKNREFFREKRDFSKNRVFREN